MKPCGNCEGAETATTTEAATETATETAQRRPNVDFCSLYDRVDIFINAGLNNRHAQRMPDTGRGAAWGSCWGQPTPRRRALELKQTDL